MVLRIGGLASGIDTDQLVKDLMRAHRMSLDSLYQKKTALEWKKTDFNTMYNAVMDFRSTVFDYKLSATLAPQKAASSDETVVTAKAAGDAANVNHNLIVYRLADGVKKTSSEAITTGGDKETLASQFAGLTGTFDLTITNGEQSKVITVDTSKSIYQLVSDINGAGVNVRASYDATLDRFFLTTTNSGSAAEINFSGSSAEGLDFLSNHLKLDVATAYGQDAEFALDGVGEDGNPLKMATNTFTISGVTYTLNKADPAGLAATVSISADVDGAVESVKAFIEAYNNTLSKINGELNEARYRDYPPLTAEQKKELKESEVTAWEEKARSGMLSRDPILRGLVQTMRSDISTPIAGLTEPYNCAAAIGITTGNYQEGGKLHLNESKLREALQADPDILKKIFGKDGSEGEEDGLAVRLYDSLKTYTDRIAAEAGKTASLYDDSISGKRNKDYAKRIATMEERMLVIEDRYYRQFAAMEKALNELNAQSSWLYQQLSYTGQ